MTSRPDDGDDPRLAEALRRALARGADEIHPLGDGLTKIRARTARSRRQRWLVPIAAATAAFVVAGGVAWGANAIGDHDADGLPIADGSTSPVASASSPTEPTTGTTIIETPAPTATVPVYYLGAQPSDTTPIYKVFREFRRLPADDASDRAERVRLAVTEMFANAPLDDDYFGIWPATASVLDASVDTDSAIVTLNLTGLEWTDVRLPEPDGRFVAGVGEALVQELVYTATAAASKITSDDAFSATGGVRLLIDGVPVGSMLGVDTSQPVKRDPTGYQAIIWITDPEFGEVVGDPITVRLVANLFEGGPPQWELTQDGAVIAADVGSTGQGGRWDDYEFTIDGVAPGTYQLEVFDVDGRGERDFAPYDTKTITVH